jgi:hypothetical protein
MFLINVIRVNDWVYNRFFDNGVMIAEIMVHKDNELTVKEIIDDVRGAMDLAARYGTVSEDPYGEDLYVREVSKGGSKEELF